MKIAPAALIAALLLPGCATHTRPQPEDAALAVYEPSPEHPYGRLNPAAPPETAQYAFMIGAFDCALAYKEFQDGEWVSAGEGRATWNARYILNGHAILDEFRDPWGANIDVRTYDAENDRWIVQYTRAGPVEAQIRHALQVDGNMVMISERVSGGFAYTERVTFHPVEPGVYRWTQEVVYSETSAVVIAELECRRR